PPYAQSKREVRSNATLSRAVQQAQADRLDRSDLDQGFLERLVHGSAQPAVEIGAPLEVALVVAHRELAPQPVGRMEMDVLVLPARPVTGTAWLDTCRAQGPMLRLVPVARRPVHLLPGELLEDQERREPRKLVEGRLERVDVMEDTLADDCVERTAVELLERDCVEARARRRAWIDANRVVTGLDERGRDPTVRPAPELEHARRRRRQLREYERREVHDREPRTGPPHRGARATSGRERDDDP